MRNFKKIVCFLLVVILFGLSSHINALAITDVGDSKLITALGELEYLRDEYNLTNVDFEKFKVADPIHTYHYTDNGFVEGYEYYPLLIDNVLRLLAIKTSHTEDYNYQLTTSLVAEISEFASPTKQFAIVYGCDGCYFYDGQQFILVNQYCEEGDQRLSISASTLLPSTDNLQLTSLTHAISVGYSSNSNMTMRLPVYYSCNVSPVYQTPYEYICWAACTACIYNYKNTANLTAVDVARDAWDSQTDFDHTLNSAQVEYLLQAYGLPYSFRSESPGYSVLSNIQARYPVVGGFYPANGGVGHLCVIYAVHITSGCYYIMNPDYGFQSTTYYPGEGDAYIVANTGVKMILQTGFAAIWD